MRSFQIHISSVKLNNFLSFYDGLVEFDSGLTVIVGPNGSGKTSIFHAIKFALGSNQRENRYSKWSDFIRHGSSSAEVELTVQANGQSRKFVRKISRDGIPRAYVDGKRVKAAVHQSMVESLGFDVDNPLVFMPQERINALRDMDPIEVRKLVEEGTGLAVLRDRISFEETKVQQNRERLDLASNESRIVQRELELLQHDIKRLERKRELQKEKSELTLELKWATLDDLRDRIETIKQEVDERELGLGKVLEESSTIEEQIRSEETKIATFDRELEGTQVEIGTITARIDEEERRLSRLEDDGKKTIDEVRELDKRLRAEERRKTKATEDIKRAAKNKEQLLEKRQGFETELIEIESERTKIEDELAEFAEWNSRRAEVHGNYRALQAEIKGKDLLLRSLQEKLQIDEAEFQEINNKWGHVWSKLETIDEKELTLKKSQLERQIATLNESRFRETSTVSQLQKDIGELRIRLSETSKRVPDEVQELKKTISEHELSSVVGPLVELLVLDDKYATSLEAVLSQDLAFAFIADSPADFSLLQKLRNNANAQSPIILLNTMKPEKADLPDWKGIEGWFWETIGLDPDLIAIMRAALGDFVLTTNSRTATRVAEKENLPTISLDGYITVPTETRTVSYPKHEASGIVATAPLQKKLKKAEHDLTIARKRVTESMGCIEKLTNEREEVMDLLGQITRWSGTWDRRKKLYDSIPEQQERVIGLDDELKALQVDVGKAERKLRTLDGSQPPERSRLIGQQSAIRIKLRRTQQEITKVENTLHGIERDVSLKRQELKGLEESITMLSERANELKDELKTSKSESATIARTLEELKLGLDTTRETYDKVRSEQLTLRDTIRVFSERLVELNLQVKSSRLQVIQAKRQYDNFQTEVETTERDLTGLERPQKIKPVEIVREQLLKVRHLLDDYNDVSETVAHTQTQLEGKMAELSKRVVEIQEELDEAESTVKDIRDQYHNGMNKMLHQIEKEVNSIMNTVEFSGEIRFELAMIKHEYGVAFKSKIKSDEFGSLSAGSGGERSLIAIGLILALQRFNPAPIYAMDEIDTFLDATNTEMVSKLLHDSSRRSQFILFTPAKSTHLLKHADKRLGVVSPSGTEPSVVIESPRFSGQ
ncbi:MAG: AAA family ATPase [Candidatus Thorarchaeota archaeon]